MGVVPEMASDSEATPESRSVVAAPDGSFSKRVLQAGRGLTRPNEGSACTVLLELPEASGRLDEALLGYPLGREASLRLGDGEGPLSATVDACLETMSPGEASAVEIAAATLKQAARRVRQMEPSDNSPEILSGEEPARLRIELRSFTRDKDIHEMTPEEVLERAGRFKSKGSRLFGRGSLELAERAYLRALRYLLALDPLDQEGAPSAVGDDLRSLRAACHLNVAAVLLRRGRHEHVVAHCDRALALAPASIKGLYRRGVAYTELQEYDKARADLARALELSPASKPVRQQWQTLQGRVRALDAQYARAMSKMFGGQ